MARKIVVTSGKGGVGKTTSAVNIAASVGILGGIIGFIIKKSKGHREK